MATMGGRVTPTISDLTDQPTDQINLGDLFIYLFLIVEFSTFQRCCQTNLVSTFKGSYSPDISKLLELDL